MMSGLFYQPHLAHLRADDLFTYGEKSDRHSMKHQGPPMDILESKESLTLYLEVVGLARDDVRIELHDNLLTISGTVPSPLATDLPSSETASGKSEPALPPAYRLRERVTGHFIRQVVVPNGVDIDQIQAKLENGLLRVEIPKQGKNKGVKVVQIA